ncbi:transcriptional regulator [Kosmotoga arenicorallina S304]|uniref:Transcriptional regulator n=1 Tax=Kosmotoga arenicorallina S304 TaxID=1453497 RepID=A0A176K024_9BACT|nr:LacI family DNA-binding transcriptional regulator [Kosmotoga arenicorallina]OAA29460.1 transcriptional regulator [Kosmotoga arenicorallina S304]
MKRPTLKDVAQKAGTSLMTVSRVVNNRPGVSDETKAKIMKAIEELGYRPHSDARSLRVGKTGRIGVVVSDIRNPFYAEMVGDIEDLAEKTGMTVIVTDTERKLQQEQRALETLYNSGVDSIIIAPEGYSVEHLESYKKKGINIVSFGVHCPEGNFSEVWIDEIEGARKVGKYLLKRGVKRVVLIMGNPRKFTTSGRTEGFIQGFGKVPDYILHLPVNWQSSYNAVIEMKKLPEAFFCYNDLMALGVIKALREKGAVPGKDVAVVGYDDVFFAEISALTTVRIDKSKMVNTAFTLALSDNVEKIKFVPKLILRKSA